jgi:hypothetical protein
MPFWLFLLFELTLLSFLGFIWLNHSFPNREYFQAFFLALMFANGVQHLVWSGAAKKYVPGLITAPVHIAVFLTYYFRAIL